MVVLGTFNVSVRDPFRKTAFPEIVHENKVYVVAAPGMTFEVEISRGCGDRHQQEVQALLTVDSLCPGYCQLLRAGETTRFDGVLKSWGSSSSTPGTILAAFQFADIQAATAGCSRQDNAGSIETSKQGKLQIRFEHFERRFSAAAPLPGHLRHESRPKLGEDKKFFMLPSLAAVEGPHKVVSWTPPSYVPHTTERLAEITIYYDTARNLMLRKVLDPRKPQHAQILAEHGVGAHPSRAPGPADAAPPHRAAAGSSAASRTAAAAAASGAQEHAGAIWLDHSDAERRAAAAAAGRQGPSGAAAAAAQQRGLKLQRDEVLLCDLSRGGGSFLRAVKQEPGTPGALWQVEKRSRLY